MIANRTLGRARELAQQFGAEAVLLAEIPEQLIDADIVITSTASQLPMALRSRPPSTPGRSCHQFAGAAGRACHSSRLPSSTIG